jgi:adenylyltransferase/sulfurtransferase
MDPKLFERYSRQILFAPIGKAGQERLIASSAVLVGCGALGTAVANLLVRAGLGRLRIVDRDFVEPSNLQRQTLFDETDAREALPKAVAAERRLRAINSEVAVEGIVADVIPDNAEELLAGFPLILDGTDNFETRFLVNDVAVKLGVPWIYAAAVAGYGCTMLIRPGETACLACLVETPAGHGAEETCDTVGVLNAAVGVIGSLEAAAALKLLTGNEAALDPRLVACDAWTGQFRSVRVARNPACRACVRQEFIYLEGGAQPHITMCGRDSVQIHERGRALDLAGLGRRVAATAADVRQNDFLLRFRVPPASMPGENAAANSRPQPGMAAPPAANGYEITVFADGRAIIKGTRDPAIARSLYARYIGK